MDNLSDKEILSYALANGIIDIGTIQKQIEMNKRQEYLKMHNSKVWQSTDGKWYTFLPDETRKNGRRLVKRSTKDGIENLIVDFYKNYSEPQTIEKTYNEWINRKVKFGEISNQTVDRYNVDFNKFFCDYKDKNIKMVTEDFLDDFILDNIKKYNMKSKSWSNLRTIIKGMFIYAKKRKYTDISIVSYLSELDLSHKIFNQEKKDDSCTVFYDSEIKKIVDYISGSNKLSDIAILFAIYTGMRVGEIVALKWEDIFDDYIHINRTQIRYKDENGKVIHQIRDFPKTEAGIRNVVIVPELRPIIRKLRKINPFTEYIFSKDGECIHKHNVCARLYYICDLLKIQRRGMHSLRRSYATKLINAGVEDIIVISQMGHTDIETTKKYYYKNNSEQKYIVDKISNAISI